MKTISAFRICLGALLATALVLALPACARAGGSAVYGTKVKYAKGTVLKFPDFDLTYTGSRHVASSKFPLGFNYDDFTVTKGGTTQKVSWSSGTGEIDWADFKIGGTNYALELRRSRKFGQLKDNELVVSRQ